MNNSVFGKTLKNLRKRVSVKLVRGEDEAHRQAAKPLFAGFKVFNDSLAAIHLRETKLLLNRPIYIGPYVLDLSMHLSLFMHSISAIVSLLISELIATSVSSSVCRKPPRVSRT